jgi:hypothetical protein
MIPISIDSNTPALQPWRAVVNVKKKKNFQPKKISRCMNTRSKFYFRAVKSTGDLLGRFCPGSYIRSLGLDVVLHVFGASGNIYNWAIAVHHTTNKLLDMYMAVRKSNDPSLKYNFISYGLIASAVRIGIAYASNQGEPHR